MASIVIKGVTSVAPFLYPIERRNVMGWLIFFGGAIVGGAVGFFIACIIMINNTRVGDRNPKKR